MFHNIYVMRTVMDVEVSFWVDPRAFINSVKEGFVYSSVAYVLI